ncbi:unnamed protein product [Linum trigynum]|uniref:Uncharacterized protein n=1 Tax=Linum trigynum TaxID=586398 RepID=A0AAV2DBL7_9ROSI
MRSIFSPQLSTLAWKRRPTGSPGDGDLLRSGGGWTRRPDERKRTRGSAIRGRRVVGVVECKVVGGRGKQRRAGSPGRGRRVVVARPGSAIRGVGRRGTWNKRKVEVDSGCGGWRLIGLVTGERTMKEETG